MEKFDVYLQTLPMFAAYFGLAVALFLVFLVIYMRVTPYDEFELIRQGNTSAAASLCGSVLGFILPLSSVVANSLDIYDMALWSTVALFVQLVAFFGLRLAMPTMLQGIPHGNVAQGLVVGIMSLAAGIVNAACMFY